MLLLGAGSGGGPFLAYAVLTVTNAEKLSLPLSTPVGQLVTVTDWEAAGLSGPNQQLQAPSTAITACFVSGCGSTDVIGIYTQNGTNNSKPYYNILGQGDSVTDYAIVNDGSKWQITNGAGEARYESADNPALPASATWVRVPGFGTDPAPTVTSVTQGELDAGVLVSGAGTATSNGVFAGLPNGGLFVDSIVPSVSDSGLTLQWAAIYGVGSIFDASIGDTTYNAIGSVAFPWQLAWSVLAGDSPTPSVQRDDIAAEANWLTI